MIMNRPLQSSSGMQPWYRHRWPWLLMAGPAVVVVASIITLWLAIKTDDGLVTDDYYRRGLAINQTLKLSERADQLGLRATLALSLEGAHLRLQAAQANYPLPATLKLTISHPTRAGLDQVSTLTLEDGVYQGMLRRPADGHWLVMLEDGQQQWRMLANLLLPMSRELVFGAAGEASATTEANVDQ